MRVGDDLRHIHLDPVGGIAGDMFAAAMLEAFPELAAGAIAAAQALAPVSCHVQPHNDGILAGSRFDVHETAHVHDHHHHDEQGEHDEHDHHAHVHWSAIRAKIENSSLPEPVSRHAIGIFSCLAEAEGTVHGIAPDQVAFHEVGASDSIADIVVAAWIIHGIGQASWSIGPLPLGGGFVKTAHGMLPIPAPATTLLLRGLAMEDDGIGGERVTPTGAAILNYLKPGAKPHSLRMGQTGIGFGTRTLPGRCNCLRVIVFDAVGAVDVATVRAQHRELLVVEFEVDDQSGEDLSCALEKIRCTKGVHDALTMPAYGKKGRLTMHVQVLADPAVTEATVAACFDQTTTIGLRTRIVEARALPRRIAETDIDGASVRVKLVERPAGVTGKAEYDDLVSGATHQARALLRRRAEGLALNDDVAEASS